MIQYNLKRPKSEERVDHPNSVSNSDTRNKHHHMPEMYSNIRLHHVPHIIILTLFLGSVNVYPLPCNDTSCKTGSCNSADACICNLPDPSTILDGDRPFLGGRFCNVEMIMCDGTDSFWCENGGTCEEIVQGELYLQVPCRVWWRPLSAFRGGLWRNFCFHQGQCLLEDGICQCPPDWKGSADCSLPTKPQTDSTVSSTATGLPEEESSDNAKWMGMASAVSCSVGAVAGGAVYAKKLFRKIEKTPAPKFHQLSQMQTHGMVDDDDDEDGSIIIDNDKSHL